MLLMSESYHAGRDQQSRTFAGGLLGHVPRFVVLLVLAGLSWGLVAALAALVVTLAGPFH